MAVSLVLAGGSLVLAAGERADLDGVWFLAGTDTPE